ncbi:hypothetical protein ES703_50635 [subsurface metagenome]
MIGPRLDQGLKLLPEALDRSPDGIDDPLDTRLDRGPHTLGKNGPDSVAILAYHGSHTAEAGDDLTSRKTKGCQAPRQECRTKGTTRRNSGDYPGDPHDNGIGDEFSDKLCDRIPGPGDKLFGLLPQPGEKPGQWVMGCVDPRDYSFVD